MTAIHKDFVARAVRNDPLEYIMSDATVDRYGDIIEPDGWVLTNFRKNPVALFGHDGSFLVGHWQNVRVEGGKLLGRLKLLPAGISERLDEIRAAVEAGVLRAVSVGFRALQSEPIEGSRSGGVRFLKAELMECSLVSIPANPNALAVARSLNLSERAVRTVFAEQGEQADRVVRRSSGVQAGTSSRKHQNMKTLAERVQDAQNTVVQKRDALTEHLKGDVDPAVVDALSTEIEQAEVAHASLKRAEQALAIRSAAQPASQEGRITVPAQARRPLDLEGRNLKPLDVFMRSAVAKVESQLTGKDPEDIIRRRYGDDEATMMVTKAAVAGATTGAAGWAAELVNTAMSEFIETLRPVSVYPTLAAAGGGRLAFGPNAGAIRIPSRSNTPSIGGSFVGEASPIPVRRLGLTSTTLTPKKMGVISVFSREIARYSNPQIEGLLRREIIADTAITLDSILLDATAATAIRPAGLLAGVTGLTPTAGGGQAAFLGDLRKLRAPFDAASAGDGILLLMSPGRAESLALTPNTGGDIGWAANILARYNVVSSTAIPDTRVIAVRAVDFATATGDTPEFELSEQTVLHMEDTAPAQIGTAGAPNVVAAPAQSMFQTAQTAIRMLMDVNWAMTRPGMVQFIDGVTW